jgi:TatD DNase family protein
LKAKQYSLIDSHVHIDELADLPGSVRRAQSVGIKAVIAVGSDLVSNEKVLQLAQTFPGFLFPALGLHPWQIKAGQIEANLDAIDSETERCVAFGEVGLDFKVGVNKELQIRVFRSILDRTDRLNRTVIIHARASWEEALSMVCEGSLKKAVFH